MVIKNFNIHFKIELRLVSMMIRTLKKRDFEQIIKLWLEFFTEDNEEIVRAYLNKRYKNNEVLVAVDKDKVLGFIGFAKNMFYQSDYTEVIIVDKQFRRKGIARALITEFEAQTRKRNCRRVFTSVEPHNTIALKMYKALGYKECGHLDHIWGENKRDLFFTKRV